MKEHPLLMHGPLVRATLAGLKTQTRRPIKPQPPTECSIHYMLGAESWLSRDQQNPLSHYWEAWWGESFLNRPKGHLCGGHKVRSPFGQTGDRLWVRETWRPVMDSWRSFVEYGAGGELAATGHSDAMTKLTKVALRFPGGRKDIHSEKWHPSIHMPRWACRLVLPLVSVRVERVQDITEDDARAEGLRRTENGWTDGATGYDVTSARAAFQELWASIYGQASWDVNPWVWVAEWDHVEVSN